MNLLKMTLCCTLLFGFGTPGAFAQTTKPAPTKAAKLPAIKGMTYHKARKVLLAKGWKPVQTIESKDASTSPETKYGNGREFWKRGYVEVESCSGTGEAPCAFLFRDSKGRRLRVITKGEESPARKAFAVVSDLELVPAE